MDQSQDDLQAAINSITNQSNGGGASDVVAEVTNKVADGLDLSAAPVAEVVDASAADTAAPQASESMIDNVTRAAYGDPDLGRVKSAALSDLRPILETIEIAPEKKFMIYKDIVELTDDKGCIELAYNAAKQIKDDSKRAEALVYVVEFIDKLGIQMSKDGNVVE